MSFRFQSLACWGEARSLSQRIVLATRSFPKPEAFGLTDQLLRAATAVVLLIAEGSGLPTAALVRHRLGLAIGELYEVAAAVILASDRGYLQPRQARSLYDAAEDLAKKLRNLRRAVGAGTTEQGMEHGVARSAKGRARNA